MIATTRGALYRDTTMKNALGDDVDTLVAVDGFGDDEGFPVSIIEKSRREQDEASGTWRTIRYFAGRCSTRIPVEAGDSVKDLRDGRFYHVEEAERMARGLSGRSSVTLTMRRTA